MGIDVVAITLWEPWATLLVSEQIRVKGFETRPSPPHGPMCPRSVRGYPGRRIYRSTPVLVHAAAKAPHQTGRPDGGHDLIGGGYVEGDKWTHVATGVTLQLHPGHHVGIVLFDEAFEIVDVASARRSPDRHQIVGIHGGPMTVSTPYPVEFATTGVKFQPLGADERTAGDYTPGRWAWRTSERYEIDPIPATGKQGVWTPTADHAATAYLTLHHRRQR